MIEKKTIPETFKIINWFNMAKTSPATKTKQYQNTSTLFKITHLYMANHEATDTLRTYQSPCRDSHDFRDLTLLLYTRKTTRFSIRFPQEPSVFFLHSEKWVIQQICRVSITLQLCLTIVYGVCQLKRYRRLVTLTQIICPHFGDIFVRM